MKSNKTVVLKMNKCSVCNGDHLEHPQMEKKMPKMEELTNDCAPHLHHPQIPASSGHTEEQFDPKKGFKHNDSIMGKK